MNNDLKIILGDYESFVQSHTTEINEKEVIYCITLKRTIISCPECGSRMNIKDYRKCKVIHNMIRGKNTSLIPVSYTHLHLVRLYPFLHL